MQPSALISQLTRPHSVRGGLAIHIALELSGLPSPKLPQHRIFTIASSYKTPDDSCHTEEKYSHRHGFPFYSVNVKRAVI